MKNSLMIYLSQRFSEENSLKRGKSNFAGPVITISREVGCNGTKLADLIAKKLNSKQHLNWKVLSKEVFYESARELNMNPEKVRKTFKKSDRYTFEEILNAFGNRNYKSEQKIVKSVTNIIRSFALDGFCIIVGRAGHIIAQDIENSLHIKLTAPLPYRINTIKNNNGYTDSEAKTFIEKVEKERLAFRKAIKLESSREDIFDITLNRDSFSDSEIIEVILTAFDKKINLNDIRKNEALKIN